MNAVARVFEAVPVRPLPERSVGEADYLVVVQRNHALAETLKIAEKALAGSQAREEELAEKVDRIRAEVERVEREYRDLHVVHQLQCAELEKAHAQYTAREKQMLAERDQAHTWRIKAELWDRQRQQQTGFIGLAFARSKADQDALLIDGDDDA